MNSSNLSFLTQYLPILIPLAIFQIGLMIFALVDLLRREHLRGPKWLWIIIVVLFNIIGPLAYFLVGREDE